MTEVMKDQEGSEAILDDILIWGLLIQTARLQIEASVRASEDIRTQVDYVKV